jgi:hypothetical protein
MKEFGFVYSEEVISLDGKIRVIYGYSDGEKTPLIIEPRVIDAFSEKVIIDLWRTYCNGTVEFGEQGFLSIKVENPRTQAIICVAEIDLAKQTFSLAESNHRDQPLDSLRQIIIELRGN